MTRGEAVEICEQFIADLLRQNFINEGKETEAIATIIAVAKSEGSAPDESGLKPCPFCGSSATQTWSRDRGEYVICYRCGVRVENYASPDAAIEAWNRRAK